MSLYYVQKFLYQLNRDARVRKRFDADFDSVINDYDLADDEIDALRKSDIGLLYIMGVNGQLLMHYAAMRGYAWDAYLEAMRAALRQHGPVRAGIYAVVGE